MTLQTVISNSIADNSININKLDVADGNAGEFLQTNGSGILSFATAASTLTGASGFNGMQVFQALNNSNVEQTWTKPAGVQSILYFITAAGDSGTSGANNDGLPGVTILGHHDVSNLTSLQLRVGTEGVVAGSVSNLPQTGPGFSSYIGNLVIGGNVTSTDSTEATGTIATAQQGTVGNGGDLLLPGVKGNSFWPGFGQGGSGGAPSVTQCSSGGGTQSSPRPGGIGQPGLIVILEFG